MCPDVVVRARVAERQRQRDAALQLGGGGTVVRKLELEGIAAERLDIIDLRARAARARARAAPARARARTGFVEA